MRGIAFIGGESPGPQVLKEIARGADLLVAADSGLIICEGAGLTPDWILGDMDSLDLARLDKYPPERVLRYPADKDFTDTELALIHLREKGCDEVWIAGGGGGSRLDHVFAIRSLFEREDGPDKWFPGKDEICCVREGTVLSAELAPGSLVSVFPLRSCLGEEGWEAESSGLKWPLKGLAWKAGSFGVSNVAMEGPVEIRSVRGRFMVFLG